MPVTNFEQQIFYRIASCVLQIQGPLSTYNSHNHVAVLWKGKSGYESLPSISSMFYAHVFLSKFWRQKLQSWNETWESCPICFCTKNACIKCWWNWRQNGDVWLSDSSIVLGCWYYSWLGLLNKWSPFEQFDRSSLIVTRL